MPRRQSSGSLSHARWCVLACVHNAESPVQCRMLRVAPRVLHVACAAGMAQGRTFAAAWGCKLRLVACGKLAARARSRTCAAARAPRSRGSDCAPPHLCAPSIMSAHTHARARRCTRKRTRRSCSTRTLIHPSTPHGRTSIHFRLRPWAADCPGRDRPARMNGKMDDGADPRRVAAREPSSGTHCAAAWRR